MASMPYADVGKVMAKNVGKALNQPSSHLVNNLDSHDTIKIVGICCPAGYPVGADAVNVTYPAFPVTIFHGGAAFGNLSVDIIDHSSFGSMGRRTHQSHRILYFADMAMHRFDRFDHVESASGLG